ncbi:glycosyltransferase [Nakamurella lactea]|uniref:glycosyltransferase n=1 Tax=Nakamurella lactea TaxID=459515 RepID=UPI0004065849|nr:glycosyltransferase [Nakamurella lactea]
MRISVVGPIHPFKGGIAQHTAAMANALTERGHQVRVENWNRQYPRLLYPGQLTIDDDEVPIAAETVRRLSWNRPDSWFRVGRAIRNQDLVVVAHVGPIQVPAYRSLLAGMHGGSARRVIVAHNVLPHERSRTDAALVRGLFGAAGRVITHSEPQAELARSLTPTDVVMAPIAPFLPRDFSRTCPTPGEHRRLLFFGLVRRYKGLDVLIRALADGPPDIRLKVAGEFWGGIGSTKNLIAELGLGERIELIPRYAAASEVPGLFSDVDALVAPYREATGSQAVWTGFQFGVPVIATETGRLAADITPGVDGLLAQPNDVGSLSAAINDFYLPGRPELMRTKVHPVDPAPYWDEYVAALTGTGR